MRIGYEFLLNSVHEHMAIPDIDEGTSDIQCLCTNFKASLVMYSDFHQFRDSKDDSFLSSPSTDQLYQQLPRSSQSKSTPPHSSTPTKRSNHMDSLIFVNSFDKFAPGETEKLEAIFAGSHGSMPTKRHIKGISEQLGMAQCKIRRWIENKLEGIHGLRGGGSGAGAGCGRQMSSPAKDHFQSEGFASGQFVPIQPKYAPQDPEFNPLFDELEGSLEQVEGLNGQISTLILDMLNTH